MATHTQYAVRNIHSYELLSDWVATREEAEQIATECEQHETQPEVQVIERPTPAVINGKTIQIDRSGVGHCWKNVAEHDLTDDLFDTIAAEIIDGDCQTGTVVIGGIHYRWK